VQAKVEDETARDLATLEEVCAYLDIASLAFPLDRDHIAIYLWTTAQVLSRHGLAPSVESVFELLGEIGVHHQALTDYQEHDAPSYPALCAGGALGVVDRFLFLIKSIISRSRKGIKHPERSSVPFRCAVEGCG